MQFINKRETLVSEALDGMLRLSGGRLARLSGEGRHNVVVDTTHDPDRNVSVISGGGSGHEPSHAGFVGRGMLTAAVCGNVFASPSVDAILATILAATGKAGCLLVVKNYTGDRLNFGLAAEKARAMGRRVGMVIVADDIALPGLSQPRGVAGTLFVHKVAGYLAATGSDLDGVIEIARKTARSMASLGISLGSCTIPGVGRENRVPEGKAELGLGIHGEPGVELVQFDDAHKASAMMLDLLFERVEQAKSYALLLNNLGGTTPLEMSVIADSIFSGRHADKIKLCVGPAPLMTALDMHGFSMSLLPLNPLQVKALKHPVGPRHWPEVVEPKRVVTRKTPALASGQKIKASSNDKVAAMIIAACDALIESEVRLNSLDAKVGDGDTGTTVASAARALKARIGVLPLADMPGTFEAFGKTLSSVMGGSSGVLLAIMFAAASIAATEGDPAYKALAAGVDRMREYGGASLGDRTMIDALVPALAALVAGRAFSEAAGAAREGADKTALMDRANAGRSSYVSAQNLRGHNDPGAEAVAIVFEALGRGDGDYPRRKSG